jgi:hypothetical protein
MLALRKDFQMATSTDTRSFGSTMLAVAWSFIGLRRRSDFERDVQALKPGYVIAAGVIGAALLVGTLITAVRFAVS